MKITHYQQVWDLWITYKQALEKYVLKYTKSPDMTHEIVGEVLLKVHKSCCSDIEINNVKSWLFQISYHTTMDYYRQYKPFHQLSELKVEEIKNDIYQELSNYLEPLIGFLPDKYAYPLRLADLEGLKQQDIAQKLNLSLTATKSRIQRARKMLKQEIHTCFHLNQSNPSGLIDFSVKESCKPLKNWEAKN